MDIRGKWFVTESRVLHLAIQVDQGFIVVSPAFPGMWTYDRMGGGAPHHHSLQEAIRAAVRDGRRVAELPAAPGGELSGTAESPVLLYRAGHRARYFGGGWLVDEPLSLEEAARFLRSRWF